MPSGRFALRASRCSLCSYADGLGEAALPAGCRRPPSGLYWPVRRFFLGFAGLAGAAAVIAGASADHALTSHPHRAHLARIAAQYGLIHAAALLAVGLLLATVPPRWPRTAVRITGWCFVVAEVFFSGGLYVAAAGSTVLLPLVPVGGTLFILGWLALFASAFGHPAS